MLTAEQSADLARHRLEEKLVGFDPTMIIVIIEALIALFKGICPAKAGTTVQASARERGLMARLRVRRALREAGLKPLTSDIQEAEEAVLSVGADATPEEIESFINGCCD